MIDAYEGDLTSLDDRDLDYATKQFDLDIQRAENDLFMAQSRLKTLYQANGALQARIIAEKVRRAEAKAEEQPEAPLRATIDMARMSIITEIVWNEFSEEGNGLAGYVEHYRGTKDRQDRLRVIESMQLKFFGHLDGYEYNGHPLIFVDPHVNEGDDQEDNTWCGISEHFTEECDDSPLGFKIVNMDYKKPVSGKLVDVWFCLCDGGDF